MCRRTGFRPSGSRVKALAHWIALGALAICLGTSRAAWCAEPAQADESARSNGATAEFAPRTTMQRFRGEAELGAFLSTPFQGSGGSMGFGWRFALGIGWDRIPLTFGIGAQGAYFGESNSRGQVLWGGEAIELEKARRDAVLFLDFLVRLRSPDWPVRPYLEGVAGPKRVRTDYEVKFAPGTLGAQATTEDEWTYTIGAGVGLDVPLSQRLWLTGGVRHLAGGEVSNRRTVAGAEDAVIRYSTGTTITTFSLGVAGRFGGTSAR